MAWRERGGFGTCGTGRLTSPALAAPTDFVKKVNYETLTQPTRPERPTEAGPTPTAKTVAPMVAPTIMFRGSFVVAS